MQLDVPDDLVGVIVIKDLQDCIMMNLEEYHDGSYDLVNSMLKVLEYYMVYDDFIAFKKTLPNYEYGADELTVTDISENADGSANISVDIPMKDVSAFASEGVKYVLMKSVFGNPSDDELVKWVERGKQEERVDKRVEELLKDFKGE